MKCWHVAIERDHNSFGELFCCRYCGAIVAISVPELERIAREKFNALERESTGERPGEPGCDQGA